MNHPFHASGGTAVVVGASLSGLMSAVALSHIGMNVTMLERSNGKDRGGAALPVADGLLRRLMGRDAVGRTLPSGPQAWADVHSALRAIVEADSRIRVRTLERVARVDQDKDAAWAVTEGGEVVTGDVVVGADGHASVVRRHVAPERSEATFAGYLIWLGIVDERELAAAPWPAQLAILEARDYCLNAYYLPGADGSQEAGRRRLGFGWYDAGRNDLLRASGAIVDDVVRRTLRADDLTEATYRALMDEAEAIWPDPWREAIRHCLARRAVIGAPVGEYMPSRLSRGRVCLVGDAAHVPSPMTGKGFDASAWDAQALAGALETGRVRGDVGSALRRYESMRLDDARELVSSGYAFSRSFARCGSSARRDASGHR